MKKYISSVFILFIFTVLFLTCDTYFFQPAEFPQSKCKIFVSDTLVLNPQMKDTLSKARVDTVHTGADIYFTAVVESQGALITSRKWSFGDGITDTNIMIKHRYLKGGIYKVVFRIVDFAGGIISDTVTLHANTPPDSVKLVSPLDSTKNQPVNCVLRWQGFDSDTFDSKLKYSVLLWKKDTVDTLISWLPQTSLALNTLVNATGYKWKVMAKDKYGDTVSSPTYLFTTIRDNGDLDGNAYRQELVGTSLNGGITVIAMESGVEKMRTTTDIDGHYSFKNLVGDVHLLYKDSVFSASRSKLVHIINGENNRADSVILTDIYPPVFKRTNDLTIRLNQKVKLTFQALDTFYSVNNVFVDFGNGFKATTSTDTVILFTVPGEYVYHLKAIDQHGNIGYDSIKILVNNPPTVPTLLRPVNGCKIGTNSFPNFAWICSDSDAIFPTKYSLYIGKYQSLTSADLVRNGIEQNGYSLWDCGDTTGTYFWKIAASDSIDTVFSTVDSFSVFKDSLGPFIKFQNIIANDTLKDLATRSPTFNGTWSDPGFGIQKDSICIILGSDTIENAVITDSTWSFTYPKIADGSYLLSIIVQDSIGNKTTVSRPFYVNSKTIVLKLSSDTVLINEPLTFTASVGNVRPGLAKYSWNFNLHKDNTWDTTVITSDSICVMRLVSTDSIDFGRVKVLAIDDSGMSVSATKDYTVLHDAPKVSIVTATKRATVREDNLFTANVINRFGTITMYKWDDGITPGWDDSSATMLSFSKKYYSAGIYTVRLYVRENNGDAGTDSIQMEIINDRPVISTFLQDDTVGCNDTVSFKIVASDLQGISDYKWDFNSDGIVDTVTLQDSVKHIFPRTMEKGMVIDTVIVTVSDSCNAMTSDTAIYVIIQNPLEANLLVSPPDTIITIKDDFKLINKTSYPQGSYSRKWIINGVIDTSKSIDTLKMAAGNDTGTIFCMLIVNDSINRRTDTSSVTIHVRKAIPVAKISVRRDTLWSNDSIKLYKAGCEYSLKDTIVEYAYQMDTASSDDGWPTGWTPFAKGDSMAVSAPPVQRKVSLRLKVTSKDGFSDTADTSIYVKLKTIYVDCDVVSKPQTGGTWQNAFKTLDTALTVAFYGSTINMADGKYESQGGTNNYFDLKNGIKIIGGFNSTLTAPNTWTKNPSLPTVLSGAINNKSRIISCKTKLDSTTMLKCLTIEKCNLGPMRGGIYFPDSSTVDAKIDSCIFRENKNTSSSSSSSGALYLGSGAPRITNCTFFKNVNSSEGCKGAAIFIKNASPVIQKCHFDTNTSFSGSALYIDGGDVTTEECFFKGNNANTGGAIYIKSGKAQFDKDTFEGCTKGGAVYIVGGQPFFSSCKFSSNISDTTTDTAMGGAVTVENDSSTFDNCLFVSNKSFKAGSVCVNGGRQSFNGCKFVKNNAVKGSGGAVYIKSGTPLFNKCTFDTNQTRSTTSAGGGAIFSNSSDTTYISACVFSGNKSSSNGGGIELDNTKGIISSCTFSNDTAVKGGAISLQTSTLYATNCTFYKNISGQAGGACYNSLDCITYYTNCTFHSNLAKTQTGAAITWGVGHALFDTASQSLITNCLFYDTITLSNPDIDAAYLKAADTVILRNCLVFNHTLDQSIDTTNILFKDPEIVAGLSYDPADTNQIPICEFSIGGAAQDAGTTEVPERVKLEIRKDARGATRDNKPDIGAYEIW
jgi:hypothetical protein